MIIVETERQNLKSMKDLDQLNYSINQHLKKIKEHSDCKKILELFQLIGEHSVKYSGISFMRNKIMAKKLGVHVRTIQRYTRLLEDLHILLKVPTNRKNNRGQASNTYVILPVLKSVATRICHGGCHPLDPSFKPLKQESNNISLQENKIVEFVVNRVNDSIKKGKTITYLSSYINRIITSLEKQAIFAEAMRQDAARKQLEEEHRQELIKLGVIKEQPQQEEYQRKVPFYNWLES